MEIKKLIIWAIIWVIALFIAIPKSEGNEINYADKLELPSVIDMVEDEIKRIEEEKVAQELEQERLNLIEQKEHRQRTKTLSASRGDFEGRKYRIEKLIVTAYAPFDNKSGICNDGDPTKTSTGTRPDWGTIAVNPKRFPYGTKFYIEGYGYGVGFDTGGAMRKNSNKIDIYMDTYEQAISWGKREIEVIVFEDDK